MPLVENWQLTNIYLQERVMKIGVAALQSTYNTTFTHGSMADVLCKWIIPFLDSFVADFSRYLWILP